MCRIILTALAASALCGASTVAATAHISLQQKEAAPGTFKAVLGVPHGCDGEATRSLRVQIPEGFIGVKPMPKPGWEIEIEEGAYAGTYRLHGDDVDSGPKAVTWHGGSLSDAHYDEFVLHGTLAGVEPGQKLYFPAVQTCASGEEPWTEIPTSDARVERPAPVLTILTAEGAADGHDHQSVAEAMVGDIGITNHWARAMLPGQPTAGAYMTIENYGQEADRLVSAASPAAGKVEIHTMEVVDDVMVMRPVEGGLEIPANGSVALEPGGLHLMLMDVAEPFVEGGEVPVTLVFEKTGEVELSLPVRSARAGRGEHSHEHDH
ncbi:DUF1775 domain-containing protein [Chelativorans sp. Marseille-P2723]|uniref:DUF1775 domain-containing protein n=1 Tax=Chelativorans sp. Marseille-P2723 TaxID=2709133 RepID=UPI001570FE73|nr:DUF1775 domain-containing protein [Chelativorans sp. Marseille-P2723]